MWNNLKISIFVVLLSYFIAKIVNFFNYGGIKRLKKVNVIYFIFFYIFQDIIILFSAYWFSGYLKRNKEEVLKKFDFITMKNRGKFCVLMFRFSFLYSLLLEEKEKFSDEMYNALAIKKDKKRKNNKFSIIKIMKREVETFALERVNYDFKTF